MKYKVNVTVEIEQTVEVEADNTGDALVEAEDEVYYSFRSQHKDLKVAGARAYYAEEI